MRFSRSQRLITKADFKAVFDQPYKVSHKFLIALFKKNNLEYARLGLVIQKRYIPQATNRNRIRRILRESFRLNQDRFKGFDIIVLMRQSIDISDNTQLREGITQLWEKLLKQSQVLLS